MLFGLLGLFCLRYSRTASLERLNWYVEDFEASLMCKRTLSPSLKLYSYSVYVCVCANF